MIIFTDWYSGLLSLPQKKLEIIRTNLCNPPTKILPEKSMNLREKKYIIKIKIEQDLVAYDCNPSTQKSDMRITENLRLAWTTE